MILPRGLQDTAPPDPRTRQANIPSLLFSWWCTGCALVIILFRLCGRMVRNDMLFVEDKIIFASLIPLFIRMGLVHVILLFGTNNVKPHDMSQREIDHRMIGSKLVLASRIFYAMFIWMNKWTISEFLKRLTQSFWRKSYEKVLRGIRFFLLATFIAVVISTLAECQPFDHYWQVVPDPGPKCRQGWAQLITMGAADTITDIVLVCFPTFIVLRSNFNWRKKFSLICLFSLSAFTAGVTLYRVPAVIDHHSRQQYRTVWASAEILAAAAVSNAVVLGSFLRDRGLKKQKKYKHTRTTSTTDSVSQTSTRRATLTQQTFGSDEDLFRGMCYRPSMADGDKSFRPPTAMRGSSCKPSDMSPLNSPVWKTSTDGTHRNSEESNSTRLGNPDIYTLDSAPSPFDTRGYPEQKRRVSFFDVGGLVESGEGGSEKSSTLAASSTSSTSVQDFGADGLATPTRPSRAVTREPLDPIQGSPSVRPEKHSSRSPSREPDRRGSEIPSLKDVGGLLPPDNLSETMSIKDYGGLLNSTPASPTEARRAPYRSHNHFPSSYRGRKGSEDPSLKDIGGLLPPDNLSDTMSLKDIGGLLHSGPSSPVSTRRETFKTPPTSPPSSP